MNKSIPQSIPLESSRPEKEHVQRTIGSVLHNRFLDHVQNSGIRSLLSQVFGIFLALAVPLVLHYFQSSIEVAWNVLAWQNGAFVQGLVVIAVWHFRSELARKVRGVRRTVNHRTVETLEGIPTLEILAHLFEAKTFTRMDVMKKFGCTRSNYDALVSSMKSAAILVRGDNNAHVLNCEFTREHVAAMLSNAAAGNGMSALVKVGPNSYSGNGTRQLLAESVMAEMSDIREIPIDWQDSDEEEAVPIRRAAFQVRRLSSAANQ